MNLLLKEKQHLLKSGRNLEIETSIESVTVFMPFNNFSKESLKT